jgi:hypothetical protein
MAKTLGIYVSSDLHLEMVISVCEAAKRKGVDAKVFFTHTGTRLCQAPRLKELEKVATIALCKVGFEDNQLSREEALVDDKAYSSQSWHAEMIYDCDRYLTF